MKLDVHNIRNEIANLLVCNPELAADDVLRADMIEGETEAFEFLGRLVTAIGKAETTQVGLKQYIDVLKLREARFDRRIQVLRQFAKSIMETANLRKAELPMATLSIRNGPHKVIIVNEHELPDEFWRVKREPDKTKIKVSLQSGVNVSGAALSNGEPSLAILIR